MDQQKTELFLAMNTKYYPPEKIPLIADRLRGLPDEKYMLLNTIEKKDPTTMLLISIFAGFLGIDRFMLGDVGMGVLKLLTGGCCGVLTIIDWFCIMDKTRQRNFDDLMLLL